GDVERRVPFPTVKPSGVDDYPPDAPLPARGRRDPVPAGFRVVASLPLPPGGVLGEHRRGGSAIPPPEQRSPLRVSGGVGVPRPRVRRRRVPPHFARGHGSAVRGSREASLGKDTGSPAMP